MIRVEHGDMLDVIPRLMEEGIIADAIITDPPYGLEFMGKEWDGADGFRRSLNPADVARNNVFGRLSRRAPEYRTLGHVFQQWCGKWASACFEILKPGGYLVAFGGTRTHHRLWCAIEDAGFIIQDGVLWLYGQGFPKGRTQLKPAWEPIVVAYKPGGKRSLQIDECKIPTDDELRVGAGGLLSHIRDGKPYPNGRNGEASAERRYTHAGATNFSAKPGRRLGSPLWGGPMKRLSFVPGEEGKLVERLPPDGGRWPANVCHDGSDEVMEAFAAFDAPGQQYAVRGTEASRRLGTNGIYSQAGSNRPEHQPLGDGGSPARFYYCAKADAEDRWGSKHPTVKPVELLKWLVPLFTPKGGLVIDAFAGSGTTGVAALATGRNSVLVEREDEYVTDINERLAFYRGEGRHSLAAKNRNRRESRGTLI